MSKQFLTKVLNLEELGHFARAVAELVSPPVTLGFIGDLGAGKTTFIREFVKHLGSADLVSSPTFVLQHEYTAKGWLIEHWDLYRLEHEAEELQEQPSSRTVRLVEWAQYAESHNIDILLEFLILGSESRQILITGSLVDLLFAKYPSFLRSVG